MTGIWDLEPHTEAKHQIYRSYLDAWFPILIRKFGSVTYAEGFAGCGVYTRGEPGSPIIALRSLLRRRHQFSDLKRARFLLVEKERQHAEILAEQLAKLLKLDKPVYDYDDGVIQVALRCGKCEDTLPALLAETRAWGQPILAIFDTFGGGVPAGLLQKIAANRSSEVVYTVLPQHFVRFANQERGDDVFADSSWRSVKDLPTAEKRQYIAAKFAETMTASGFPHTLRFDLGTDRGDLLNLWFGTRSLRGVEKFKDATWKADPVRGAGFRDPRDPDQQLLPMRQEPDLAPLQRLLHARLLQAPGNRMTVEELRTFTTIDSIFRAPHVTPALARMEKRGWIDKQHAHLRLGSTSVTGVPAQQDLFGFVG
ncbi:three-Cys-motif partner protein TcmP [Amycolatopsis sp. NPDC059657]|uniref:three-Cys-motif partner protein TcmP n=1 Tax=Amycolatopsis sp. NPDC059657 TaxID=3346899 RepID=UPI003672B6C5